ncbi:MAG TPA: orotidine-5'-phosphate decarboxylase [Synergistaceae bacterium]|jgi:orotidine-5'-phosphate decarboxylase|nr:MAG: Orotidine 5'-phosphate decarboxylase [Synergistales bacterium 57_84]KUK88994.1 MAG: Orotidine 5'-phosphate decarboxylase [Synergistales bacterium 58_81]HBG14306.1 orotidine-5'-phosphate decarboxylase [Synergistaceae bacterium]HCP07644.1 orotidine-5'-phosphate decarboxylase [Synergistaceae bacterium]HCR38307.1 orotidine-5'-phosphate decarboxylase [Synergistaceae bacterium]
MTRRDGPDLILAVDVKRPAEAERILDPLKGNLRYVKIGPRLFAAGGMRFVRRVIRAGFSVFLDLKLHDIPNTVAEAVDLFARNGIWALTLHASGGEEMLRAAGSAKVGAGSALMLLGVTVLTSMDQRSLDMTSPGSGLQGTILSRARLCEDCGLDGIVCSPRDLPLIVPRFTDRLVTVVPGIRDGQGVQDDQKRTASLEDALEMGADYVVIGRPIVRAPLPLEAMSAYSERLERWRGNNGY